MNLRIAYMLSFFCLSIGLGFGATRIEWEQLPAPDGVPLSCFTSEAVIYQSAAAPWKSNSAQPIVGFSCWGCFSDWETHESSPVLPPGDFDGEFDVTFWTATGSGDNIMPGDIAAGYYGLFSDYEYDWAAFSAGSYRHLFFFSCDLPWAFQPSNPGETYFISVEAVYTITPEHPWCWWPSQTGLTEHPIYRSSPSWEVLTDISGGLAFNLSAAAPPVPGDYSGDGTSDLAIFRPSTGLWKVRGFTRIYFGQSEDIPVPGNYFGDSAWDFAIFRPNTRLWKIKDFTRFYFGQNDDTPIPHDYNGDGTDDPAVYRSQNGLWLSRDLFRFYFGSSGDIPVPADYNGNGLAEAAFYRPADGLWKIRYRTRFYFGGDQDFPLVGDYDGDGTDESGIYNSAKQLWKVREQTSFYLGQTGDEPILADFDGDGTADPSVDRSGLWILRDISRIYFGGSNDVPVTNPY